MYLKTSTLANSKQITWAGVRLERAGPMHICPAGNCRRFTRVLPIIAAFAGCLVGCKSNKPQPLPHHVVRIDALVKLHPSYPDIARLRSDNWVAQREIDGAPLHPQPAISQIPQSFEPPQGLPPDRVKEHEATVRDDAARYISQLETALAERDKVQIAARKKAEEQLADTEYADALSKKTIELRDVAVVEARGIQRELDRLNYRAEALASQMRVYSQSGFNTRRLQDDVRIQQVEVDRRIQEKSSAVAGLLKADFKGLAQESLKAVRDQLNSRADANVKALAEQLAAGTKQEVADARKRLDDQPSAIEQLTDTRNGLPIKGSPRTDVIVHAPILTPGTALLSSASRLSSQDREARESAARSLEEMIAADTKQCVERIARQQGWLPDFQPVSKASDWTNRAAGDVKKFWAVEIAGHAVTAR
jgi:hypothetical protein